MFRRILVPLDGSPLADAALVAAGAVARKTAGEVRLIHVVEVPQALSYPEYRAEDRAWGESYLADASRLSSLHGVPVSTVVREGGIMDELQREAAEWRTDVTVMTTHGRGGLSRLWMGSIADRFVRSSARPVMLVRPKSGPTELAPFAPGRIVVPLDGSAFAEAALPYAASLAKAFGARLVLLRGLVHFGTFDVAHLSLNPKHLEEERKEAENYLAERAAPVQRARVETETVVLTEPGLAEAISNRAADDLIVMTTNGRGGLDRAVFGSVADKVVRSATCPVLVIRPERSEWQLAPEELSRAIAAAVDSVAAPADDRG